MRLILLSESRWTDLDQQVSLCPVGLLLGVSWGVGRAVLLEGEGSLRRLLGERLLSQGCGMGRMR